MVGFSSSDQCGNNIYTIRWLLITESAQLSTVNAWATKIDAGAPSEYGAIRALQKYMHEFHEDRDHAMCNIQNRSIPAVQLTQLRKLSNKDFQDTGVLKSSQSCQVLQCKVAARQWRCLAEIVSFSGSCSRCLVLSPLPCPTLPK
jgi:hypothetical protein